MDADKGLKTAVAETHDPDARPPGVMDGQQLALLPLRNTDALAEAAEKDETAGRGRGRPPGSKNKSTQEWTDFLLKRYPSPLIFLAEVANRPVGVLAAELLELAGGVAGSSKPTYAQLVELLKLQLGAAKELAPYLHQKQPMAIQGGDNGLVNLFIGDVKAGAVAADEATDLTIDIIDVESEENQGVSGEDCEKSNDGKSNDDAQGAEIEEENEERASD